ncbi:MAG: NAD(P)-dependent oxidoreductase, partial [Desemzia incerta]
RQPDMIDHLKKADVVVNILPLTSETKAFFDQKMFTEMKEGTLFINVGRGPTVNTKDLIQALDDGKLAFAGLDVFETEPLPEDSPLWDRKDVLVTPHISGNAEHYNTRLFNIFEENIRAFVEGEELPRNLVDYDKSY